MLAEKGLKTVGEIANHNMGYIRILDADSPLELSVVDQASLVAAQMIKGDVPLISYLKQDIGSAGQLDAAEKVYKYWVRDFKNHTYKNNKHIKNWRKNVGFITNENNFDYIGINRKEGGILYK